MKKSLILFLILCSMPLFAQVNYTANDLVNPYPEGFRSGINPGYYGQNWDNYTLADIMGKNYATQTDGIGVESLRTNLPESLAEIWGYDTWTAIYDYYAGLGLKDNTLVIGISSPDHRDHHDYCPNDPVESEMFANLYEPIWDNGANGTPVNDNNYFALYVYNLIQTVGQDVKFWEIWNEPGFDISGKSSRPKGEPGNWWDNDPEPCDFILRAPIYHYIRTLRIAYEVIKTISPDDYVVLSGVGNDSFLDALLRNTDNPNNGDVSVDFPLKSGAYFDVMGFHAYPSIDGSVRKWNNNLGAFDYSRHSDGAVDGFKERLQNRLNLLSQYGYDGNTYPKKLWTITEFNVPRKSFGEAFGSDVLQRNYIIKMVTTAIEEHIVQTHLYAIGELEDESVANDGFQLMGLYKRLNDIHPGEEIITEQGIAYKTTIQQLKGTHFDLNKTNQLQLPSNIGGGAYQKDNGQYIYVLWAKTQIDNTESASANYSFPNSFGYNQLYKMNWDFSKTHQFETVNSQNISLSGTPIFLNPNTPPSTLSVSFPDGNVMEGTGTAAEGGTTITWAAPIISTTCPAGNVLVEINNVPENNFYTFGERSIQYKFTDDCGNIAYASVLVKVASTGGTGNNCHPHHWDFNFLGSFKGHKYLLSRTKMSLTAAKQAAATHGGQLVSIESEAENDFLQSQLYEVAVIGLSDSQTEGQLAWESGAPVTFTKFDNCSWCGTNTPNNDFLEFHPWNGLWSFVDNDGEYFFVVELSCDAIEPVYSITLDCPTDITLTTHNPDGLMINLDTPTINSDCPSGYQNLQQTKSWGNSNLVPVGTSQVNYEVQDNCSNTATCTQNITVNLEAELTVNCLDDIQIQSANSDGIIVQWDSPTAQTTCNNHQISITQEQGLPSGSLFPVGKTTIQYKIQDACGNTKYCSFDVIVQPPNIEITLEIECPQDIEKTAMFATGIRVHWNEPNISSNCPQGYTLTQNVGLSNGDIFPVGTSVIVYQAKDNCGNELFCSFEIHILPPTQLEIECPENITVEATSLNGTLVEWNNPIIHSNCANGYNLIQTQGFESGHLFPIGTTIIEYTVSDSCGQQQNCSFEIHVNPWKATTSVICPQDTTILTKNPQGIKVSWERPIVSTNCPEGYQSIQILGPSNGSLLPIGTTFIGYKIQDIGDGCDTKLECNFKINVVLDTVDAVNTIENQIFSISKIYPNPTKDAIHIEIMSAQSINFPIVLSNTLGQQVMNTHRQLQEGKNIITLDVLDLESGVYYLRIGETGYLVVRG